MARTPSGCQALWGMPCGSSVHSGAREVMLPIPPQLPSLPGSQFWGLGGAWEWRSAQCRDSSSQGHLSLKTPVLDLRVGVQPSVQHPPLGCRGLQAVLGIGSFVFSLQLCCQAFCKPAALLGPRSLPPEPGDLKTPSRSTPKACLLASTPSPVQGTQASSCPTPALGKQEAG